MGSARAPRRPRARALGRARVHRGRPGLRLAVPFLLGAALVAGPAPLSSADTADTADAADQPGGAYPTRQEVAAARQHVADRARDVGAIRASLLLADRTLEAAAVQAEIAAEEYHGAMWRLARAEQELADARREAAGSRRSLAAQRDEIGTLVATSYQNADRLTALQAFLGADGPEAVLDQFATFQGVSDTLQAGYDRYAASYALARSFAVHAERVRVQAGNLAEEARAAKERAEQAAAATELTAAGIAAEKERLIRELADAQQISVSLARQRQAALEELARERAAARALAEAKEAARQQALAEDKARALAEANEAARQQAEATARAEAERRARDQRAEKERRDREQAAADAAARKAAAREAAAREADRPTP